MGFLKYASFITLLVFTTNILAQDFVIENVTLFDGVNLKEDVSVIIKEGKVHSVTTNVPKDLKSINGAGKFLMPALTNSHVHIWSTDALNEAAVAGVLNVLDMAGMEQYQGMLATNNNKTEYARYFFAGNAATVPEGHGTQFGYPVDTLTEPEEAEAFVNKRIENGAHYIKIIVEPGRKTLRPETTSALIAAANKKNKKAVVHISTLKDAQFVNKEGASGLVHIWRDSLATPDEMRVLAENKDFFIIPTLLTTKKSFESRISKGRTLMGLNFNQVLAQIKLAYDIGIPILAGTDPPNLNINNGTDLYEELFLLSEAGINTIDILKSATSLPADYFDLPLVGRLETGCWADMILLNENPLNDIHAITSINTIWKMGNEVVKN